jgi:hypothetical protein
MQAVQGLGRHLPGECRIEIVDEMLGENVCVTGCEGVQRLRGDQVHVSSDRPVLVRVPGELLFRLATGHVTLLRAKRPADAPLCSSSQCR